jgi:hypothetical protein
MVSVTALAALLSGSRNLIRGRYGINPGDAVASILVSLWHHSSEPVPIGAAVSLLSLYIRRYIWLRHRRT